jgi:hypothetical protein
LTALSSFFEASLSSRAAGRAFVGVRFFGGLAARFKIVPPGWCDQPFLHVRRQR